MSQRTDAGKLPRKKKWERSKRLRCARRYGQGRMCEKKWQAILADFKANAPKAPKFSKIKKVIEKKLGHSVEEEVEGNV